MNPRKYNPEMLFLLYYPFNVPYFQKIDCKKQASPVFLFKTHPVTNSFWLKYHFKISYHKTHFVKSVTISFGHF